MPEKKRRPPRETVVTRSEKETFLLARRMARRFKGREVVLLTGDLGAGKTVFAKGIASGLGFEHIDCVCSPTYTLVNIYVAKHPIFHIDLYRLENRSEILDLGWDDYLGEGVVVVEWAEKMAFPVDGIRVSIKTGKNDERKITISR